MRKTLFVLVTLTVLTLGTAVAEEPAASPAQPRQDLQTEQTQPPAEPQAPAQNAEAAAESCPQSESLGLELSPAPILQAGQSCGGAICGKGQYCCNPSCSICVPYGWSCTQQSCN